MRSTEHLPAGTPSAWSLRSRHSSRQRSGAGDRGRSQQNMKTQISAIITLTALLSVLPAGASESEQQPVVNPFVSEIQQIKEEIKRQEIILVSLKDRLLILETGNKEEKEFVINLIGSQPVLKGIDVSMKEIALALNQRAEISSSYPIIIRGDKTTPYSSVVKILELAKKAGLSNIAFAKPKE